MYICEVGSNYNSREFWKWLHRKFCVCSHIIRGLLLRLTAPLLTKMYVAYLLYRVSENCLWSRFINSPVPVYYYSYRVKNDKVGRESSMRRRKVHVLTLYENMSWRRRSRRKNIIQGDSLARGPKQLWEKVFQNLEKSTASQKSTYIDLVRKHALKK